MRRADRLFRLIQRLRGRRIVTARVLARELEVSERTVYRDIAHLVASGVPIEGEAGVGYRVPRTFELPPLMFTRRELEAVALGVRVVSAWADEELATEAERALDKIAASLPRELLATMAETTLVAPAFHVPPAARRHLRELRAASHDQRKVRLCYERPNGEASTRVVWPLGLAFWGTTWTLTAHCELRDGFRTFRVDRIAHIDVLDQRFEETAGRTFADWLVSMRDE